MSGRRPLSLALTLPPSYSNNIVSEELCLILSIRLYNHIPYCFSGLAVIKKIVPWVELSTSTLLGWYTMGSQYERKGS